MGRMFGGIRIRKVGGHIEIIVIVRISEGGEVRVIECLAGLVYSDERRIVFGE